MSVVEARECVCVCWCLCLWEDMGVTKLDFMKESVFSTPVHKLALFFRLIPHPSPFLEVLL